MESRGWYDFSGITYFYEGRNVSDVRRFTLRRVSFGPERPEARYEADRAMDQRKTIWRGGEDRQLWLSMLVQAMEEAARPEVRGEPCPPAIVFGLRTQLAQPVSHYPFAASAFGLRH